MHTIDDAVAARIRFRIDRLVKVAANLGMDKAHSGGWDPADRAEFDRIARAEFGRIRAQLYELAGVTPIDDEG